MATPGVKWLESDIQKEEDDEEEPDDALNEHGGVPCDDNVNDLVTAVIGRQHTRRMKTMVVDGDERKIEQRLRFDDVPQIHLIQNTYEKIYGRHPSRMFFTGPIGSRAFQISSPDADRFTGKTARIMRLRTCELRRSPNQRMQILEHVLRNGAAWENNGATGMEQLISLVRTKKQFENKRLGAKAANAQEALSNTAGFGMKHRLPHSVHWRPGRTT